MQLIGDGGFGISDGFEDHEKWLSTLSVANKQNIGTDDLLKVVSYRPYTRNFGDSVRVAFAVVSTVNKQSLDTAIQNARVKDQQIITNVKSEFENTPISFN